MEPGPPLDQDDAMSALAADLSDVLSILFIADGERDTLNEVVELAVATIEGCDLGGIFIIDGETVTTPVQTSTVVAEVDALQLRAGRGPCLDAITQRTALYAADLLDEDRWPEIASAASASECATCWRCRCSATERSAP